MSGHQVEAQALEAAARDAREALAVYDGVLEWTRRPVEVLEGPMGAEVWAFDRDLTHVLLVRHRWRGWVAPGGQVDPGETPREAARRELFEETGVQAELLATPAAATVRSYHPGRPATASISYLAVTDRCTQLKPEHGQPAVWHRLDEPWQGWFAEDRLRMRRCVWWLSGEDAGVRFPGRGPQHLSGMDRPPGNLQSIIGVDPRQAPQRHHRTLPTDRFP